MTIGMSLRRRAIQSKIVAVLLLIISTLILAAFYFTLPAVELKIIDGIVSLNQVDKGIGGAIISPQIITIVSAILEFIAAISASYVFARIAVIEIETSARLTGLADALSVVGNDLDQFEKAASIFVPKSRSLLLGGPLAARDLRPLADLIKLLRP